MSCLYFGIFIWCPIIYLCTLLPFLKCYLLKRLGESEEIKSDIHLFRSHHQVPLMQKKKPLTYYSLMELNIPSRELWTQYKDRVIFIISEVKGPFRHGSIFKKKVQPITNKFIFRSKLAFE